MSRASIVVATVVVLGYSLVAVAAPGVMRYQGRLTDGAGQAIMAPTSVTFSFYAADSGGSPLASFSDTHSVTPNSDGIYTTEIGSLPPGSGIPAEVFAREPVYLNVNVGGEDLAPRMLVTSSAYALQSETAQSISPRSYPAATAIQAGHLVALGPDGQLYAMINPTVEQAAFRSGNVPAAACAGLGPDRAVIVYRDAGQDNQGAAVVATMSGSTPGYGAPAVFESENHAWILSVAAVDANTVVVVYSSPDSNSRAAVGTVSGSSISFGAAVEFDPDATNAVSAAGLSDGRVVLVYNASGTGKAVVGTVSGTTLIFGAPTIFCPNTGAPLAVVQANATQAIIAYNDFSANACTAVAATASGNTVALGTPANTWGGTPFSRLSASSMEGNRIFLGCNPNGYDIYGYLFRVDGDSVVAEANTYYGGTNNGVATAFLGGGAVLLARSTSWVDATVFLASPLGFNWESSFGVWGDGAVPFGAVGVGRSRVFVIAKDEMGNGVGAVAGDFFGSSGRCIGVAEETVAQGANCRVTTTGGITRQFHDLVPGSLYSMDSGDGISLGYNGTVIAGKALSADEFLVASLW